MAQSHSVFSLGYDLLNRTEPGSDGWSLLGGESASSVRPFHALSQINQSIKPS